MDTIVADILVCCILGILVLIGIYQGWKGNKFFNAPLITYFVIFSLLVAVGYGMNLHNYNTEIKLGLTVQSNPNRELGNSIFVIITMFIIYAIIYGICYLISGRKAKHK